MTAPVGARIPKPIRPLPLFTPKWDRAAYQARLAEPGFDRGYRLRAFSEEEQYFPSWVECYSYGVDLDAIARNPNYVKVTGVDLSSDKRPGNAIVTVAVDPATRRRVPIDVRFGAWKSNETVEQLQDVDTAFRPTLIMVEDNGYQQSLEDWARATKERNTFWMKLQGTTTTGQSKRSEVIGLPALQVEFKARAWVLPADKWEGKMAHASAWARLDYEMKNHPLSSSTDGVMALWFARQGIELFGGLAFNQSAPVDNLMAR